MREKEDGGQKSSQQVELNDRYLTVAEDFQNALLHNAYCRVHELRSTYGMVYEL